MSSTATGPMSRLGLASEENRTPESPYTMNGSANGLETRAVIGGWIVAGLAALLMGGSLAAGWTAAAGESSPDEAQRLEEARQAQEYAETLLFEAPSKRGFKIEPWRTMPILSVPPEVGSEGAVVMDPVCIKASSGESSESSSSESC